jgi:hypothetical protein
VNNDTRFNECDEGNMMPENDTGANPLAHLLLEESSEFGEGNQMIVKKLIVVGLATYLDAKEWTVEKPSQD